MHWLTLLIPILAVCTPLALQYSIFHHLIIRAKHLYLIGFGCQLVALFFSVLVFAGTMTRIADWIIASPAIQPKGLDAQLIRLVSKLLTIAVGIIIFLEGGRYLGIPLTTLIGSAGVTGLAVALAAQDTLKNLFGGIMIMVDKPFRRGERIVVKGHDGIVEEIGLRSTKLRTLHTDHLVSITNEELAKSDVENLGRKPFYFQKFQIQLPLSTPHHKVTKAIDLVKAMLNDYQAMPEKHPPRVFLSGFEKTFSITVMYWYENDYWSFVKFNEDLNLKIIQVLNEEEISIT